MYVTDIKPHLSAFAITALVTGEYDKNGLPEPLELRFYFSVRDKLISQLIIISLKRSRIHF